MRLRHAYLLVYSLVVTTAIVTLWQSGVLSRVSGRAMAGAVALAVGFGVLLEITSRPGRTRPEAREPERESREGPDR